MNPALMRLTVRFFMAFRSISKFAESKGITGKRGEKKILAEEFGILKALARERAEQFVLFVRSSVDAETLRLRQKSPFTKKVLELQIHGGNTPVMRRRWDLLQHLEIEEIATGYRIKFNTKRYKDTGMSAREFVIMQAKGGKQITTKRQRRRFAILLSKAGYKTGAFKKIKRGKGGDLRNYAGAQGRSTYQPRPFFERAARKFMAKHRQDSRFIMDWENDIYAFRIRVR